MQQHQTGQQRASKQSTAVRGQQQGMQVFEGGWRCVESVQDQQGHATKHACQCNISNGRREGTASPPLLHKRTDDKRSKHDLKCEERDEQAVFLQQVVHAANMRAEKRRNGEFGQKFLPVNTNLDTETQQNHAENRGYSL